MTNRVYQEEGISVLFGCVEPAPWRFHSKVHEDWPSPPYAIPNASAEPMLIPEAVDFTQALKLVAAEFEQRLGAASRIALLEKQVAELRACLAELKSTQPIIVPVEGVDLDPFEIIKPFSVVISPDENEWVATFFSANISSSGDNPVEAFSNLKELILMTFEMLESEPKLGTALEIQKKTLAAHIRRK